MMLQISRSLLSSLRLGVLLVLLSLGAISLAQAQTYLPTQYQSLRTDTLRLPRRLKSEPTRSLRPQSALEGLSVRRSTTLVKPEFGVLPIRNGSTVILSGETPIASYEPSATHPSRPSDLDPHGVGTQTNIRLMGRTLFFSDTAERVEIVDITGQVVLTYRNVREAKLSLGAGIYVMRCNIKGRYTVSRLILR